ncbi:MAG TPA: hypothetical protein VH436_34715 [Vicinamibacterales bacterium]|jgi:hypothetical protein
MQLRTARLCLDCEEVHDAQQCPVCASETFAYLTRWVPVPERRQRPRPAAEPAANETATAYGQIMHPPPTTPWRAIRRGAVGLALFGVAGWLWKRTASSESTTPKTTTGSARGGTP